MLQWLHEKQNIHLELTSSCQASCPACSRVYDFSEQLSNTKTPNQWSLKELKNIFNAHFLGQINEILLCGNYGDPMGHQEITQWVDYALTHNKDISFLIHTNGALQDPTKWERLGRLLKNSKHQVKFSIDGLRDTNHLYRRGVSWNQLMQNAKAFISTGATAVWKFIEFDHNAHQIERARELSLKMGFSKFELTKAYGDKSGHIDVPQAKELDINLQKSFEKLSNIELENEIFSQLKPVDNISCQALTEKWLYFDYEKRLWPCCWLAQDGDHRLRTLKREHFFRKVYDNGIDYHFNDLEKYSVKEILSSSFFQKELSQSWSKASQKPSESFPTCLKTCGRCN